MWSALLLLGGVLLVVHVTVLPGDVAALAYLAMLWSTVIAIVRPRRR